MNNNPGLRKNRFLAALLLITFILSSCAGLISGSALLEFEKGLSLYNRGEYQNAADHFVRATEIDPEYTKAYIYLGRSYIGLKQWYSALIPLRTAYRISPKQTRAEVQGLLIDTLSSVVVGEIKKGNFQSSREYLTEYLQLNEASGGSTNDLVAFLIAFASDQLKNGNLSNTYSALKLALEVDPQNSDAYIGLGRAYFKDGKIFDALNNIRKAILLDPSNSEAKSLFNEYSR